jgi:hypothetical protein
MDLVDRLKRERDRADHTDGSECCHAPTWTCCARSLLDEAQAEIVSLKGLLREAGRELSIFTTPEELVCRIRSAVEEDPTSDQG